jgi:hypothetical protein
MCLLSTFSRFAHRAGHDRLSAAYWIKAEDQLCLDIQRGLWKSRPLTASEIGEILDAQRADPLFHNMILPERVKQ